VQNEIDWGGTTLIYELGWSRISMADRHTIGQRFSKVFTVERLQKKKKRYLRGKGEFRSILFSGCAAGTNRVE